MSSPQSVDEETEVAICVRRVFCTVIFMHSNRSSNPRLCHPRPPQCAVARPPGFSTIPYLLLYLLISPAAIRFTSFGVLGSLGNTVLTKIPCTLHGDHHPRG